MSFHPRDPRDIPVLTDAVDVGADAPTPLNLQAAQLAIVTETLKLADALLHQAAKDMEASLFERVFDRLRAQLPDIVERVLREQVSELPAAKP